jgi:hypothetical protein
MLGDADREVRQSVAAALPPAQLNRLIDDPDYRSAPPSPAACRTASWPGWSATRSAKCARSSPAVCRRSHCT